MLEVYAMSVHVLNRNQNKQLPHNTQTPTRFNKCRSTASYTWHVCTWILYSSTLNIHTTNTLIQNWLHIHTTNTLIQNWAHSPIISKCEKQHIWHYNIQHIICMSTQFNYYYTHVWNFMHCKPYNTQTKESNCIQQLRIHYTYHHTTYPVCSTHIHDTTYLFTRTHILLQLTVQDLKPSRLLVT